MKRLNRETVFIILILLIALAIRLWGIDAGLPYLYNPDEMNKVPIFQTMFKTGDLNPHFFYKPSLFFYLNTLLYVPYYLLGKLFGVFQTPHDILTPIQLEMGVAYAPMPSTVTMGRLLTCLLSIASIYFVYRIGRQLNKGAAVGLLGAAMLAVSPTHVAQSRYILENIFLVFFITIVVWASIRIYQQGKTKDYVLASIATGLAVSSKYPGVIIAIVPICAHFLHHQALKPGVKDYRIFLLLALIPTTFLMTTPFAVLDYKLFLTQALGEVTHYSTGHAGMEGNALVWYITHACQTAGITYILALIEMGRGFYFKDKTIILLSAFPLVNFAFISSFTVRNDRTFLPLVPMLCVLAAVYTVHLFNQAKRIRAKVSPNLHLIGTSVLAVLVLIQPTINMIRDTRALITVDSRETSRIWIDKNLPTGASIVIEAYSPFVDPSQFSIQTVQSMIVHEPEWYIEQGFDYLVFSKGMYGRFYQEPEKYTEQIARYDEFFSRFELVQLFTDGGYEIRIYKTE